LFRFNLKGIEVYHGSTVRDNSFYIEHFKERGKDVEHFLRDVIGRDKRYLVDSEKENSLTMALQATEKLLKNTGVSGKDLDMIIFSSQLPEYIAPPSSIKIHYAVGGKETCICYDMNVNCIGMSAALEHTAKYMSTSPHIKYALIVGCDYVNMTVSPENERTYGHYGDAACAVLLERTEEDCGLVDSRYSMRSASHENIVFPACGFSKMFTVEDREQLRLLFQPFECANLEAEMQNVLELLERNHLATDDISMFCFSQYVYKNIELFRNILNIGPEKSLYIGDEYGYTGTSSPFIVLYESLRRGLIKKGDYVVIWTLAAGSERITLLLKI
jgi:3-oxoacyl-[acyl-carrier-protein] synthase-3